MKKYLDIILRLAGFAMLLLIAISLFSKSKADTLPPVNLHIKYKPFTKTKIIGYSIAALGGIADGLVEGYEFDGRRSFERKWNSDRYGFFGSLSHLQSFVDNDPSKGRKSKLLTWWGVPDFYHVADDNRKAGYITGGIVLGIGGALKNKKKWHYLADFAIGWAVSATAKSLAMKWVRS